MEKLIITAAICGAEVTKEMNEYVPYTIEEIVAATLVDEAGGEKNPLDGMHAVLNVIMNRAKGNIRNVSRRFADKDREDRTGLPW